MPSSTTRSNTIHGKIYVIVARESYIPTTIIRFDTDRAFEDRPSGYGDEEGKLKMAELGAHVGKSLRNCSSTDDEVIKGVTEVYMKEGLSQVYGTSNDVNWDIQVKVLSEELVDSAAKKAWSDMGSNESWNYSDISEIRAAKMTSHSGQSGRGNVEALVEKFDSMNLELQMEEEKA